MSRRPWGVPTQAELLLVLIGLLAGFLIAWAVIGVTGRALAGNIIAVFFLLVPATLGFTALVSLARADMRKHNDRLRELEDERQQLAWRYTRNCAATNKPTGLGWTGFHSPGRTRR